MVTRRTALKAIASGTAAVAYSGMVPGLTAWAAAPALRVRRGLNAMKLDDPDLETYRDFVGLMRSKTATTRVSWVGFANQHGDTNDFKYCPHGDWYFLPWHRGFVDMYEKTAMSLMKNPKFAMPYWEWVPNAPLPAAFTDPKYKKKDNPLYVPGRGDPKTNRNQLTGPNALTNALVGPAVMQSIFRETDFELFGTSRYTRLAKGKRVVQTDLDPKWITMGGGNQGVLESTPHNNVHNNIGAFMPQTNSPRDPIFMMHHGNIDRIWTYWNALGRKNTSDPLWLDMPFTNNYIAPDGKFYSKFVKDLLSTDALGYTYDQLPKPDNIAAHPLRAKNAVSISNAAAAPQVRRIVRENTQAATPGKPLAAAFSIGRPALEAASAPRASAATAPDAKPPQEIHAVISDIAISNDVRAIRIFVNHPSLSQNVPDTDPHFVRVLSFLRHGSGGHGSNPSAVVDLTETLNRLAQGKRLDSDEITIQLLPVAEPGIPSTATPRVVPATIEILVM